MYALIAGASLTASWAVFNKKNVTDEVFGEYLKFVAEYNKVMSQTEFYRRLEIFSVNYNEVQAHNELYEQGLAPFNMTINQFSDLTHEEFLSQYASGAKPVRQVNT